MSVLAPTEAHADNAWQTPGWLVARIADVLGGIDLDPCTAVDNPCNAKRFYTVHNDGILQPWITEGGGIYVNPPYGKTISHWIAKAMFTAQTGARIIMLLPSRTSSMWFHDLLAVKPEILLIRGRLRFRGATWDATFPSLLASMNVPMDGLRDLGARFSLL